MNTTQKIIDKINSPQDLKVMDINELNILAEEMREVIIKKVHKAYQADTLDRI